MRLTATVFGTVHSDRAVVVLLLHQHFISWLSTLFNSISINTNCTYATESDIAAYVKNSFTFLCCLLMSNFSSVLMVFHQFFTCIALQSTIMTDDMTTTPLSASLLQKMSAAMDRLAKLC